MNSYVVLAAAAAHFERIGDRLDADDSLRYRLLTLLRALRTDAVEGDADRHQRTADEAAVLLLPLLPPGVVDDASGARFAPGTDPDRPTYQGFHATDLAVLLLDGHGMAGPVLGQVRDRLLAANALPTTAGDGYPDVIRLRDTSGRPRLPAFQFTEDGSPVPVVLDVNRILDARHDPWGAADWWLSENAWLGTTPAALLGTDRQSVLPGTARYLTESDGA